MSAPSQTINPEIPKYKLIFLGRILVMDDSLKKRSAKPFGLEVIFMTIKEMSKKRNGYTRGHLQRLPHGGLLMMIMGVS